MLFRFQAAAQVAVQETTVVPHVDRAKRKSTIKLVSALRNPAWCCIIFAQPGSQWPLAIALLAELPQVRGDGCQLGLVLEVGGSCSGCPTSTAKVALDHDVISFNAAISACGRGGCFSRQGYSVCLSVCRFCQVPSGLWLLHYSGSCRHHRGSAVPSRFWSFSSMLCDAGSERGGVQPLSNAHVLSRRRTCSLPLSLMEPRLVLQRSVPESLRE